MSWVKDTLTSSIGQKVIMSLTGLGLMQETSLSYLRKEKLSINMPIS